MCKKILKNWEVIPRQGSSRSFPRQNKISGEKDIYLALLAKSVISFCESTNEFLDKNECFMLISS